MVFTSDPVKHAVGAAALAAAAMTLVFSAGCASAPATAPPVHLDFPAPDTGPGRPDLTRADQDHIDKGWKALLNGDSASARAIVSQAGTNPAAELLSLQAAMVARSADPLSGL